MRLGTTPHDWERQLINARNEGVRGSNPRVGFDETLANRTFSFRPDDRRETSGNTRGNHTSR
jgi:hypothetical protein